MKLYCKEDNNKYISNPAVCDLRSKNRNLPICIGCSGPIPKPQDMVSQRVVEVLDKEPETTDVFRVKHHKKYLIKKYGAEFYSKICA